MQRQTTSTNNSDKNGGSGRNQSQNTNGNKSNINTNIDMDHLSTEIDVAIAVINSMRKNNISSGDDGDVRHNMNESDCDVDAILETVGGCDSGLDLELIAEIVKSNNIDIIGGRKRSTSNGNVDAIGIGNDRLSELPIVIGTTDHSRENDGSENNNMYNNMHQNINSDNLTHSLQQVDSNSIMSYRASMTKYNTHPHPHPIPNSNSNYNSNDNSNNNSRVMSVSIKLKPADLEEKNMNSNVNTNINININSNSNENSKNKEVSTPDGMLSFTRDMEEIRMTAASCAKAANKRDVDMSKTTMTTTKIEETTPNRPIVSKTESRQEKEKNTEGSDKHTQKIAIVQDEKVHENNIEKNGLNLDENKNEIFSKIERRNDDDGFKNSDKNDKNDRSNNKNGSKNGRNKNSNKNNTSNSNTSTIAKAKAAMGLKIHVESGSTKRKRDSKIGKSLKSVVNSYESIEFQISTLNDDNDIAEAEVTDNDSQRLGNGNRPNFSRIATGIN